MIKLFIDAFKLSKVDFYLKYGEQLTMMMGGLMMLVGLVMIVVSLTMLGA